MGEIYKRKYGVFIDIKVDQAEFYTHLIEIIGKTIEDNPSIEAMDPMVETTRCAE